MKKQKQNGVTKTKGSVCMFMRVWVMLCLLSANQCCWQRGCWDTGTIPHQKWSGDLEQKCATFLILSLGGETSTLLQSDFKDLILKLVLMVEPFFCKDMMTWNPFQNCENKGTNKSDSFWSIFSKALTMQEAQCCISINSSRLDSFIEWTYNKHFALLKKYMEHFLLRCCLKTLNYYK